MVAETVQHPKHNYTIHYEWICTASLNRRHFHTRGRKCAQITTFLPIAWFLINQTTTKERYVN